MIVGRDYSFIRAVDYRSILTLGDSFMDAIDHKILRLLESNSRIAYLEVARKLGLSEAAVRKRVDKLVKTGVIKRFTVEVARTALVRAYVLVTADPKADLHAISREIGGISGIARVDEVSGEFDIVCVVEAEDVRALNATVDHVRDLRGVQRTVTSVVMR